MASGVLKQEEALVARMKNLEMRDGVLQLLHRDARISAVIPGQQIGENSALWLRARGSFHAEVLKSNDFALSIRFTWEIG